MRAKHYNNLLKVQRNNHERDEKKRKKWGDFVSKEPSVAFSRISCVAWLPFHRNHIRRKINKVNRIAITGIILVDLSVKRAVG